MPVKTRTINRMMAITPSPNEYVQRMLLRLTLTGCRCRKILLVIARERSSGLFGQPCRKNERHTRDSVSQLQRLLVGAGALTALMSLLGLYKLDFFGKAERFHLDGFSGTACRTQAAAD